MPDNSHTPGPWVAKQMFGAKGNEGWVLLWPDKGGTHMRRLDSPQGFHKSDALVLAAATDLLENLRSTTSMLHSACLVIENPEALRLALAQVADSRAAVAKATGAAA